MKPFEITITEHKKNVFNINANDAQSAKLEAMKQFFRQKKAISINVRES